MLLENALKREVYYCNCRSFQPYHKTKEISSAYWTSIDLAWVKWEVKKKAVHCRIIHVIMIEPVLSRRGITFASLGFKQVGRFLWYWCALKMMNYSLHAEDVSRLPVWSWSPHYWDFMVFNEKALVCYFIVLICIA